MRLLAYLTTSTLVLAATAVPPYFLESHASPLSSHQTSTIFPTWNRTANYMLECIEGTPPVTGCADAIAQLPKSQPGERATQFHDTAANPRYRTPFIKVSGSCVARVELDNAMTDYTTWGRIRDQIQAIVTLCLAHGSQKGGRSYTGNFEAIRVSLVYNAPGVIDEAYSNLTWTA